MHFNLVFVGLEAAEGDVAYKPWRSHTLTHGMSLQDKKDDCKEFKPQESFNPSETATLLTTQDDLTHDYISVLSAGSSLQPQINGGAGTTTEGSVTRQAI